MYGVVFSQRRNDVLFTDKHLEKIMTGKITKYINYNYLNA